MAGPSSATGRAAWLRAEQRLREGVRGARAALRARRGGGGALPDFLVIGGMRCGTTSLFSYLADHPQVRPPLGKELQYFTVFHDRGDKWYRGHFSPLPPDEQSFEASPYYLFHPLAAQRVADLLPDARFIALLRDPVDRAYSHYKHSVERGAEKLSFEDAVEAEPQRLAPFLADDLTSRASHAALRSYSYLARGQYAEQLERWFEYFDRDQVLVLRSESMYADPGTTYARCLRFLGLPEHQPPGFAAHTRPKPTMSPLADDTARALNAYFEPHNRRLATLLGWTQTWPAGADLPKV